MQNASHDAAEGGAATAGADMTKFWEAHLSPDMLDEGQPAPLYHQIYLIIRNVIEQNGMVAKTLLPGEQTLTRLFAVSRITVKRALNELAADKLVSRHRGRGTLIIPRASIPVVRSSFDNLIESLQEMGLVTQIELLDVGEVGAGEAGVAQAMQLAPETRLQRAVRRRLLEGQPLAYFIAYTPQSIAARFSREDVASTAFLTLLERAGAAAIEAEQWITAIAAEPQMTAPLDVAVSTPLLKIERVMRDAAGQVVHYTFGYYRSDRFQYHVRNAPLRRPAAARMAD